MNYLLLFLLFPLVVGTSIEHIVLIGVDGLNPSCIHNATKNGAFYELAKRGASTLTNARTTIQTFSAPGWSSTLCAMRPAYTGVTSNSWGPPWKPNQKSIVSFTPNSHPIKPVTGTEKPFPCVFQLLKEQVPSMNISSYYDWIWLMTLGNLWIGKNGTGYIDDEWLCPYGDGICDGLIAKRFLNERTRLKTPSFSFVYFGNVDEVGHLFEWCSKEQEEEIGKVNDYLNAILSTIDWSNTVVVLTADHGGVIGTREHSWGGEESIVIPWYMAGPGIKENYSIQYEVRNLDIVPTLFELLNLTVSPWWTGKAVKEILI